MAARASPQVARAAIQLAAATRAPQVTTCQTVSATPRKVTGSPARPPANAPVDIVFRTRTG